MAKSITFTIANDLEALRIRDKVCLYNKYEDNKLKDPNLDYDDLLEEDPITNPMFINIETKNEFFRRVTINLWAGQVASQENREEHEAKQAEINAFDITSSEV